MVLVREIKTKSGNLHYLIIETNSGIQRKWQPPRNLRREKYEEVVMRIAEQVEAEAKAMAEEKSVEPQVLQPSGKPPKLMTVREFGEEIFVPDNKLLWAEYTRDQWQRYLDKRIYPAIGNLLLTEVTPRHIHTYLLNLQAEGYASSTVAKHRTILRSLFSYAVQPIEAISENPVDFIGRIRPRKDEEKITTVETYTEEEVVYIRKCVEAIPLKWRTHILLVEDTGMRRAECTAVRWENIDFENFIVRVTDNVGYTAEKGIYLTTTKNRKAKVYEVTEEVILLLRQMYAERDINSPFVWPSRDNPRLPMNPQSATKYYAKFGRRYGIESFHPHKLRHTLATLAITNGADVASVSALLDHKDPAFTLKQYTTPNRENMRKANDIRREAIRAVAAPKKE